MSLLRVEDLSVWFNVDHRKVHAVRGVSFSIDKGETFALVGESGAGKSMSALSIMKLFPYGSGAQYSGRIYFKDQELLSALPEVMYRIRGSGITMIFQEPMTSLNPVHTIEKQIGEALYIHQGISGEQARKKVVELLKIVHLSEAEERLNAYPHQLSGGQRQRVMIAMALANNPDLLVADEPTTALDVTIQAEILKLLKELKSRLGMALLLITHDLSIVRKMANRVGVMKDGRIVEMGDCQKIFQAPSHRYTRYLLGSEPGGRPPKIAVSGQEVLRCTRVSVSFPVYKGLLRRVKGYIPAVNQVSITINKGQTTGLVGESGSGKTTFGMAVLRLISSSGSIKFMGKEIQGLKSKQLQPLRKQMQIIFQDPFESLNPRMTVGQIVGEGVSVHGIGDTSSQREVLICRALEEVGLELNCRNRYPHEFSGGQRQRISIARALILKPQVLVLDEPTSSLDVSVQAQILELLKRLQRDYQLAYLFISHDLRVVQALSHEIIIIHGGNVVEYGSAEQIFTKPKHAYTRNLMKAAFEFQTGSDTLQGYTGS
ncbi:MAG: ABC transporter ATP-binding protein [Spirochaetota bacterium]